MMYYKIDNTTGLIVEVSINTSIEALEGFTIIEDEGLSYYVNYPLYKYNFNTMSLEPITDFAEVDPLYLIHKDYEIKKADGKKFSDKIRADIVLLYKTGQKTKGQATKIDRKLKFVKGFIEHGDWLTAEDEMLDDTVNDIDPNNLDQGLYNSILAHIQAYIIANYTV